MVRGGRPGILCHFVNPNGELQLRILNLGGVLGGSGELTRYTCAACR